VAILFCDIMDFDKIIQHEGKNLVQILDRIFRAFDQLCGTQGVQKIEVTYFYEFKLILFLDCW